ncbi:MAG: Tfp pilus assembly protein PilV [Psychroserpens sp.]|jgi:Tfp pilus assembly protein PilV
MKRKINLPNSNKPPKGFTLIEVLVASFILFLVIAAMTMVYRGALLSSNKAERTLQFSSLVEPISEQIRLQLQSSTNNELQGKGSMGAITFTWLARQGFQAKAPALYDAESGELTQKGKTFRLWHITVKLQLKKATREYQFSEVSW